MEDKSRTRLTDVINYQPEDYLDEHELQIIKNAFEGEKGRQLVRILRKVFLPSYADPNLPVENFGMDAFMQGIDFMSMPAEHVKPIVLARQDVIKFIMGAFVKLKALAHIEEVDPAEVAERAKKNSAK